MSDNLDAIDRLIKEHQRALDRIGGIYEAVRDLTSLRQQWIPGRPPEFKKKLDQLEQQLTEIEKFLQEHMRFEEHEFLPILSKYAADIISGGLVFEHRRILDSIAQVKEEAVELGGEPGDREAMMGRQLFIHGLLNNILELLEEHTNTQETIFTLAREVLARTREED